MAVSLRAGYNARENKVLNAVGIVTSNSAIGSLAVKIITKIDPFSAAIYIAAATITRLVAENLFKNSRNAKRIRGAAILIAIPIAAYFAQVTILQGIVVDIITIIAVQSLRYLFDNIS